MHRLQVEIAEAKQKLAELKQTADQNVNQATLKMT